MAERVRVASADNPTCVALTGDVTMYRIQDDKKTTLLMRVAAQDKMARLKLCPPKYPSTVLDLRLLKVQPMAQIKTDGTPSKKIGGHGYTDENNKNATMTLDLYGPYGLYGLLDTLKGPYRPYGR